MKLNLKERYALLEALPQKGNFETMETAVKVRSLLLLSDEEKEYYGVSQIGSQIFWNEKGKTEEKEIELPLKAMVVIVKSLERLDKSEQLTMSQYEVYKRIKEEDTE